MKIRENKFTLRERKCPICGKKKIIQDIEVYAYKRKSKYFCSWSCMRKWDAMHPEEQKFKMEI